MAQRRQVRSERKDAARRCVSAWMDGWIAPSCAPGRPAATPAPAWGPQVRGRACVCMCVACRVCACVHACVCAWRAACARVCMRVYVRAAHKAARLRPPTSHPTRPQAPPPPQPLCAGVCRVCLARMARHSVCACVCLARTRAGELSTQPSVATLADVFASLQPPPGPQASAFSAARVGSDIRSYVYI